MHEVSSDAEGLVCCSSQVDALFQAHSDIVERLCTDAGAAAVSQLCTAGAASER